MKKYLFKKDRNLIAALFHIIATSFLLIAFDFYKGELLNVVVYGDRERFFNFSIFFISLVLLKCLTFYRYSLNFNTFKNNQLALMRKSFFKSLISRPFPDFIKKNQGEYTNLYTNQFKTVENIMFGGWYGFQQIIYETLFIFLALVYIDLRLSLLILILCIPSIFIPKLSEAKVRRRADAKVEAQNKMITKFKDYIGAFDLIKNFNIADRIREVFSKETENVKKKSFLLDIITSSIGSIASAFSHLSLILIIFYCSYLLSRGRLNVGLLVSSVGLMQRMQYNMNLITPYLNFFNSLKSPFESIEGEINYEYKDEKDLDLLSPPIESIVFDGVNFSYSSESPTILRDFNLRVREKGIYLFTGESGSGKSTSMNLLLNYHKLDSGQILINGTNHYKIGNIYDFTRIMRQDPILLKDSIKNNISLYGDDQGVEEILSRLGMEKFLSKDMLNKNISHGGLNLSGGEAKRINLARCLLRPADILILDEPFANVDPRSVDLICQAILEIKDSYIFIISHQLPESIRSASIMTLEFPY